MNGECIPRLTAIGIRHDDATALRRIAMTLHRWHELECGDSNAYGAWAIERGKVAPATHWAASNPWHDRAIYIPLSEADKCVALKGHTSPRSWHGLPKVDAYLLRQPDKSVLIGMLIRLTHTGPRASVPSLGDPAR